MKRTTERTMDERFLEALSAPELVRLQHDLRRDPADAPFLKQALAELARREKLAKKGDPQ